MGREGIRYEDVSKVAEELLRNRKNPTISNVRVGLGNTGSNLTISRHLNEWRNTRLPELIQNKLENLAPPDLVNLAVKDVWEKLKQAQIQELDRLQERQVAEVDELKSVNHQLNDELAKALKRINEITDKNTWLKSDHDQMQIDLEAEKEARQLAQGELTGCQNYLSHFLKVNEDQKIENHLSMTQLKEAHFLEINNLKEGLAVAKDAMEDYRTRYIVDIDNFKNKNEQLEKQVFDLALVRREAETAKHRFKLDLEQAKKELDFLKQEDKLNKNTKLVLEEELKSARAEINRLNKALEMAQGQRLSDLKNYDSLTARLLKLEEKFERAGHE
jgi:DNA repair exonuclease SbcCD ATPase subunit